MATKTPTTSKTLSQTMGSSMPAYGTAARTALATNAGISNYTGTAAQNAQIVSNLGKASTNPTANNQTQSTTTLSTSNAQNKVVGIKNQIATNNQNGLKTTTGADGNPVSTYADNSVYTPPEDPQPVLSGQGGYYGDQYVPPNTETPTDAKGKQVNLTPYSPAQQQGIDDLNRIRTQANANSAALIGQIQNQYTDLIAQQNLANNSANAGATAYTIGGGRGVVSGDAVVQQTISYGIQKVKELVDAENMAIVSANIAATNNDWLMASKINDTIAEIKTDQQTAITKINDDILAAKNKLAADKIAADKVIYDTVTKPIQDIATEAAKNGASKEIIAAINATGDVSNAINASGGYLQTATGTLGDYLQYKRDAEAKGLVPMDYQTYKDQQDAKQAKLDSSKAYNNAYASAAGKAAADAKFGVGELPAGAENLDPTSQSLLANNFLQTSGLSYQGFLVLSGQSSQLSRDMATRKAAMAEATAYAKKMGVDPTTFASRFKALNEVTGQNETILANVNRLENDITATIDNLETVATGSNFKDLKWSNDLKQWVAKNLNDSNATQYAIHLNQLQNEYASYNKAIQGNFGKEISDAEQVQARNVIQSGIAKGGISGLKTAIDNTTSKLTPVFEASLDRSRQRIWDLFGVGDKYQTGTGTTKDPKTEVDTYISSNPAQADTIAKMYEVPGATDQDIYDYLKANKKIP